MPGAGTNRRDTEPNAFRRIWRSYRLGWKRRYFLARAIRRRRQLRVLVDRTANIRPADILLFSTIKNEDMRLGHFLDHHRKLGVGHFLIVDNNSSDKTADILRAAPDVSVWHTAHSYKKSRFGVDWLTWLQFRYAHGHWSLTLDADELLLPPFVESCGLAELTSWLDARGARSLGALMLDLYPKGPVGEQSFGENSDPLDILRWFDADNYSRTSIVRGGARARVFFNNDASRAPTLNKVPLIKWHRRYAYLTSTHVVLPPALNEVAAVGGIALPAAILLHTKFLPDVTKKSADESYRQEHFANSPLYEDYYDALAAGPDLWMPGSVEFEDWRQLERLGLMMRGDWRGPK